MSDNEHSGNEMEQDEHVDDLAEDEETPTAVVTSGFVNNFDFCIICSHKNKSSFQVKCQVMTLTMKRLQKPCRKINELR